MAQDLDFLTEEEARLFKELNENEKDDVAADIARAAEEARLADPEPVADPEPKTPPAPDPAPTAAEAVDHTPTTIAFLTKEEEAKLASFDKARSDAIASFDNGDLTAADFEERLKAIDAERMALTARQQAAAAAAETEEQAWARVASAWMAEHPEITALPKAAFEAFDATVQAYTRSDLAAGQSFRQQIETAFDLFARNHPDVVKKPEADAAAPMTKEPKRPNPPQTLANIPAAGLNTADDGRFSALDNLADRDPAAFEDALSKMPADQLDAYLRQGAA